jgi:hypothetical protein
MKKVLQVQQPFVVFVPLPLTEDSTIDPFRPSMVHVSLYFEPNEGWILIGGMEEMLTRSCAVLVLLQLDEQQFENVYLLYNPTGLISSLTWDMVRAIAQPFFTKMEALHHRGEDGAKFTKQKYLMKDQQPPEQSSAQEKLLQVLQEPKKSIITRNTISRSGFWLLPVLDIMDGPIIFISADDKHLDSEVYFEPYYELLLGDEHVITTRPMEDLKKKIMTYTITGRTLGALTSTASSALSEQEQEQLKTLVVVFRCTFVDNKYEFQLVSFGNQQTPVQKTLIDYLAYTVRKKREIAEAEEEEEKKLWERVQSLAVKEKERARLKEQLKQQQQFSFMQENQIGRPQTSDNATLSDVSAVV